MPSLETELAGLAALQLFLALRASVRAKVDALRFLEVAPDAETRRSAIAHFEAATRYLTPAPLRLIGIGGLSGTGKSTLASALAPHIGRAPGAVHLRSDIERKRLFRVGELDRLPPTAYTPEASQRVFAALAAQAKTALLAGQSVVVDAVYRLPEERAALEEAGRAAGADFTGLWLTAPFETMAERIAARRDDASDATLDVLVRQVALPIDLVDWTTVDAGGTPEAILKDTLQILGVANAA
jgi:predicted kinase